MAAQPVDRPLAEAGTPPARLARPRRTSTEAASSPVGRRARRRGLRPRHGGDELHDLTRLYFREMGRVSLLTVEQERALAAEMARGAETLRRCLSATACFARDLREETTDLEELGGWPGVDDAHSPGVRPDTVASVIPGAGSLNAISR